MERRTIILPVEKRSKYISVDSTFGTTYHYFASPNGIYSYNYFMCVNNLEDDVEETDITEKFVSLCREADNLYLKDPDERNVEPPMIALIELVTANPDKRTLFVKLFIQVLDGDIDTPSSLLAFCMRTLKFNEVKDYLWQMVDSRRNSAWHLSSASFIEEVHSAYVDEIWSEAERWPYYRHELNK